MIRFLALAQNELDDVFETFEYQQEGLGYLFVESFKKTVAYIKAYPDVWSMRENQIQRCLIKGFPYGVLYHKDEETIFVLAIVNLRKKPIHWVSKSVSEYSTSRIPILPETLYTR